MRGRASRKLKSVRQAQQLRGAHAEVQSRLKGLGIGSRVWGLLGKVCAGARCAGMCIEGVLELPAP